MATKKQHQINTAWFKDRLIVKRMSQRQLADVLKMDPAALSLTLRGMRAMQHHEAEGIARELGVPLADVLEQIGIDVGAGASNQVAVVGRVDAGGLVHMARPKDGPRRFPAPEGMPQDAAALRYEGDGFMDGWVGYYQPADRVGADAAGRLCVAQLAGREGWYLRVVKRGYAKGTYTLSDPFGAAAAIEGARLASAAPILWVRAAA